ncbi:MAG: RsmE family RNA methyltransferase [Verrucomicrobiota bacterium]|jgi:16S rRNA (uracil1498-N3)-methyltransferase
MHRFFLPPAECHPPLLALTGGEAHHARDVLRLARGDRVTVLDGAGRQFLCEARELDRHEVTLAVLSTLAAPAPPASITLVQAIPKGRLFESIIQKSTELGVARIIPLLSERVTTRLDAGAARDKAEKWRQTAIEAVKQCGQPWLPEVTDPLSLPALLARGDPYDLALVGSLQGDGRHPRQYFQEFQARRQARPRTVCAWIGPEGDFTPEELDLIRATGARPVDLGPLVLRSETAALCALAVINYEILSPG